MNHHNFVFSPSNNVSNALELHARDQANLILSSLTTSMAILLVVVVLLTARELRLVVAATVDELRDRSLVLASLVAAQR